MIVWLAACTPGTALPTGPVQDLVLQDVGPELLVPGSRLVLEGIGWLPDLAGPTALLMSGEVDGRAVELELPATYVDDHHLEVSWTGGPSLGLGDAGTFTGTARVQTLLAFDGRLHRSDELSVTLGFAPELTPSLVSVEDPGDHVNDALVVSGEGFLLGGDEGVTVARFDGCFTPLGASACERVPMAEVAGHALDRSTLVVPFAPWIAGISPGTWEGELTLANGDLEGEGSAVLTHRIRVPVVDRVATASASLGQLVDIEGAGFVGPSDADPSAVTLLRLDGTFRAAEGGTEPVLVTLVPEAVDGGLVRYVVNEEDALGRSLDVRYGAGTFRGTLTPSVAFGSDEVEGAAVDVELALRPVRQVVWLRFLPSTWESLRHLGLREAREAVVERVVEVVARDYAGVGVELRLEEPDDYALFATVEVGGPDPNGLGLLGYDNTPGKDTDNLRLYDRIGGLNAVTQLDGFPGYGGVFVESLFAFSEHPGDHAAVGEDADPAFDLLFDPFRPDRGGVPLTLDELASAVIPASNTDCPASGRQRQVGCAVFALGNLIGTTLSHELAHSMGLADPEGDGFHNTGDWQDALMDGGSYRTFRERAEVAGEGPGLFCRVDHAYLERILPTGEPDPVPDRQECY
ncbi:MAG: hypothetical protein H6735_34165 [Alphaproteobacteria bacterium]|nr:hypothetical protein [Alphaproteobacteria bacterium]